MKHPLPFLALSALALLAACGPLNTGSPLAGIAEGLVARASGAATTPANAASQDPRQVLTREAIDASPSELLLITILAGDKAATLLRAGENGDTTTWISPDGISLSFENGLLKATRGLGYDLFGADVAAIRRAIDAGGGTAMRHVDFPVEEDLIYTGSFSCEISQKTSEAVEIFGKIHQTTRFEEFCRGEIGEITNIYQVDAAGKVVQSRQWVSPGIGYLEMSRL